MSSDPGTPTLDQLRVFLTVVEMGSFAGAARRLGRATSVISYSITNWKRSSGSCCLIARRRANPN